MNGRRGLPSNTGAEECLIGCMLLSPNAVGRAIELNVSFGDFSDPSLALLFDVILESYNVSGVVDEVVILEALLAKGVVGTVGGRQRLLELIASPPSALNVDMYANIVLELSSRRSLIGAAEQITELGFTRDQDVEDLVDQAESLIFNVAERKATDSVFSSDIATYEAYRYLGLIRDKEIAPGISTGFRDYDNLILGLQPSSLYIIAARPSMGKSSFALNIANNVAKNSGLPVIFFSLEMSHEELSARTISSESEVSYRDMQSGNTESEQHEGLKKYVDEIASWPRFIDDNPYCSTMQMRATARRIKAKEGALGAIFVDYIQLMALTKKVENRQVEVSEISRGLKVMARELDVHVIALSQLNRQLEYRADKRPMLADLRESGSLEQDADVVTFLYRDEIYNGESPDKGLCEVIVGKNRNGPVGKTKLAFVSRCVKFKEIPNVNNEYF